MLFSHGYLMNCLKRTISMAIRWIIKDQETIKPATDKSRIQKIAANSNANKLLQKWKQIYSSTQFDYIYIVGLIESFRPVQCHLYTCSFIFQHNCKQALFPVQWSFAKCTVQSGIDSIGSRSPFLSHWRLLLFIYIRSDWSFVLVPFYLSSAIPFDPFLFH